MTSAAGEREPFDQYADQFTVSLSPFGANISFGLREAHPTPGRAQQSVPLGTMRMSIEHLKTMTFMLRKQVMNFETETGLHVGVPSNVLNQLGIAPEDWNGFWGYDNN